MSNLAQLMQAPDQKKHDPRYPAVNLNKISKRSPFYATNNNGLSK
jgi:hypothetical protein